MKLIPHLILPVVVFVSGAVIMILELAAARIIAPYLGTSIIVWTSLIGVFLAALSIGYFLGGRIADRFPSPYTLASILFFASTLVAASGHFERILEFVSTFSNIQVAAVCATIILFSPATILLGMVSPLAVRLSLTDLHASGRAVGNLYAISNTGSIIGTFLGGFILISYFGSTRIIFILALTLLTLAILLVLMHRVRARITPLTLTIIFVVIGTLFPSTLTLRADQTLVADIETTYGRHWVFDMRVDGRVIRALTNIPSGYQSLMYLDAPTKLMRGGYLEFFDIATYINPDIERALAIGGSAYIYPRHFLAQSQARMIDVVEIDPDITEIARTYFDLTEDPRLTIIHEDGRIFLNKNTAAYDAIFLDAFHSDLSIPFHLTTTETVAHIKRSLVPDGVVVVNMIGALEGKQSTFIRASYSTYKEHFKNVHVYQIRSERDPSEIQNLVLVASDLILPDKDIVKTHFPYAAPYDLRDTNAPILTDDFAPVERYLLGF